MSEFIDRWARQRLETALEFDWWGQHEQARRILHNIANVIIDKEPYEYASETTSTAEGRDDVAESEEGRDAELDRYHDYLRKQFIRREIEGQRSEPTRWSEACDLAERKPA